MIRSRARRGLGGTEVLQISNGVLRLRMAPEFGARITELTDLRSGRNWIVPKESPEGATGDRSEAKAEGASYIDARPDGWDECFPTVAPCAVPAWGGALRDHGALWARPWTCTATPTRLTATHDNPRFRFRRTLRLAGDHVLLRYSLTSRHIAPLPWIWSQHCLLACRPGERIEAAGIGAWQDAAGQEVTPGPVLPSSAQVAGKYFAKVIDRARVALGGPQGRFEISWRRRDAACVGLWFSYGGWPVDAPLYQLGIEPATAPFDRLSEATEAGAVAWLRPGEMVTWCCRFRVTC